MTKAQIKKVLFVCTGNTCRSPMAACYLKARRPEWDVQSAGIRASSGLPANSKAKEVVSARELDLGSHRSQPLSALPLHEFDLILAMTEGHLHKVKQSAESAQLLSSFGEEGESIADPYGKDLTEYEKTFEMIVGYIDLLLETEEEPSPCRVSIK